MLLRPKLIALSLFFATQAVAQRSVEASLDSTHLLIGSQTRMTLSVRVEAGSQVAFPELEPKEVLTEGLEVVRTSPIDTATSMAGTLELRKDYVLTSFDSATYRFVAPPVLVNGDTLSAADTLLLHVSSLPVDTLHLDQFYGTKDVYGERFALNWQLLFMAVLFIVSLLLSLWCRKRWKAVERRVRHVVIKLPPTEDQVALSAIVVLRENVHSATDPSLVYDQLIETLRAYISARFNVDSDQQTTPQLLCSLSESCGAQYLSHLATVLAASDWVRFANQRDDGRRDEPFAAAQAFVDGTKAPPRLSDTEEHDEPEPITDFRRRKARWFAGALFALLCAIGVGGVFIRDLLLLF